MRWPHCHRESWRASLESGTVESAHLEFQRRCAGPEIHDKSLNEFEIDEVEWELISPRPFMLIFFTILSSFSIFFELEQKRSPRSIIGGWNMHLTVSPHHLVPLPPFTLHSFLPLFLYFALRGPHEPWKTL